MDGQSIEKDNKCRKILKEKGLDFVERLCGNEFWINKNYFRKDLLYKFKSIDENFGVHVWREKHLDDEIKMVLKKDYSID